MPKFDVEHLLSVAQRHGEESGADHEVGDLQQFLRAAWAQLTEQQKAELVNGKYICCPNCGRGLYVAV